MNSEKILIKIPRTRICLLSSIVIAAILIIIIILAVVLYLALFIKNSNSRIVVDNSTENATNFSSFTSKTNIKVEQQQFLSQLCGSPTIKPHVEETRIINGYPSIPHSFPWMVSIGFNGPLASYPHVCGGSLISERFVLTAAHCVHASTIYGMVGYPFSNGNLESMGRIYLGVYDSNSDRTSANTYRIKSIITHSNYVDQSSTMEYDIALIELTQNVTLSNEKSLICLNQNFNLNENDSLYATAWGQTEKFVLPKYLLQVKLLVLNSDKCVNQWNINPNSQICAGTLGISSANAKDTCSGDSGGPLMTINKSTGQWFLVGIVSFGDYPCDGLGVYTNVKFFYNWIIDNANLV